MDKRDVQIIECSTPQEAQLKAVEEAATTGGIVLPTVLFNQGTRSCFASVMTIAQMRSRLQLKSARQKGSVEEVLSATNRPVIPEHVNALKSYLKENFNKKYIIPPMTLNVQQDLKFYFPAYNSFIMAGYIVIPVTAKLSITDGGHRFKAFYELAEELSLIETEDLDRDSVCIMITLEKDVTQVHQDFADCSKTRQLPNSLIAAYDRRNPANGIVIDLINSCPLFQGKIDSTSRTLSTNSTALFLTNQVRQMVKELLLGSYAMPEETFDKEAKKMLKSNEHPIYMQELTRFREYINEITNAIPVLRDAALVKEGIARTKITQLRKQGWVCLTATGLVVLGRVGHELLRDHEPNWRTYARRLGDIDWQRDAAIWRGNIIGNGGKVMTQQSPVRIAAENVAEAIGLRLIAGDTLLKNHTQSSLEM